MGSSGTSSSNQTSTQQATTTPWAPAVPVLQGVLSGLQNVNPNLTGAETNALNTLGASGGNQFAGQIGGVAGGLLGGGGAMDQAGNINQAYADYQRRLGQYADGPVDPNQNSALQSYLTVARNDATRGINDMFAGAGRDLSGAHAQAYGRGVGQAEAPILYDAYNQAVNRQMAAANDLYGAGNTTGGLLSALQNQSNQNQLAGIGAAGAATDARNSQQMMALAAEAQRRGIPLETMAQIAGISGPLAEAFGTKNSFGTQQTEQKKSLADTFATWTQGLSNLYPKSPIKFG